MVKVSVIVPCYNQEDYLEDALKSLIGEFKDFEVIVVNDGSSNINAENKIKDICTRFKEFPVRLINQTNQGVCAARNNAVKNAAGTYIMPLDADDMICNKYLEDASKILDENKNIGIVYSLAEFFGEKTGLWKLGKPSMINMLSQNRIFNSAMYRKAEFEKVGGYNMNMTEGCEDWDLWLSLIGSGLKPHRLDEIFYTHRILPKSRTSQALEFKNYLNIRRKIILNHKLLYIKYNLAALIPLSARIILKGLSCRKSV